MTKSFSVAKVLTVHINSKIQKNHHDISSYNQHFWEINRETTLELSSATKHSVSNINKNSILGLPSFTKHSVSNIKTKMILDYPSLPSLPSSGIHLSG
jgi:hypothetical protein